MAIDFILFDWDNTLVHSWNTIREAYNATFEHFGMPGMSMAEVQQTARHSAREGFPGLFGSGRAEEAIAVYRDRYRTISGDPLPLEGAEDLLKLLQQRATPAGVISNKSHDFLDREVTVLGWQSYFPLGWLGAARAAYDKPNPLILSEFFGASAGRTVEGGGTGSPSPGPKSFERKRSGRGMYVGDNAIDIAFARACSDQGAGTGPMLSVLIGDNLGEDDPQPDVQYIDLKAFTLDLSKNNAYA